MINKFMVAVTLENQHKPRIAVLNPRPLVVGSLSKEDALNLAAWIVALVGDDEAFKKALEEVVSS